MDKTQLKLHAEQKMLTAKHHYVPKFFLRRFAFKKYQIRVYDMAKKTSFTANVSKTAAISGYNSLSDEKLTTYYDRLIVERSFSELESIFAHDFRSLDGLIDNQLNFTPEMRSGISHFIVSQFFRVPSIRTQYIEAARSSFAEFYLKTKGQALPSDIELSPQDPAMHIQKILFGEDGVMMTEPDRLVSDYYWVILQTNSNVSFITSDRPILPITLPGLTSSFSNVSVFYVPMSHKRCIQLLKKSEFPDYRYRDGMTFIDSDPTMCRDINHNISSMCDRYLFGLIPNTLIDSIL